MRCRALALSSFAGLTCLLAAPLFQTGVTAAITAPLTAKAVRTGVLLLVWRLIRHIDQTGYAL